jgi:hypothetical protein
MVAVAQLAERRNVAPEATGSNPVRHPEHTLVEERQTRPAQTREAAWH